MLHTCVTDRLGCVTRLSDDALHRTRGDRPGAMSHATAVKLCVMFSVRQSVQFVPVVTSNKKRYLGGLKLYNRMSRTQEEEIQTRLSIMF